MASSYKKKFRNTTKISKRTYKVAKIVDRARTYAYKKAAEKAYPKKPRSTKPASRTYHLRNGGRLTAL